MKIDCNVQELAVLIKAFYEMNKEIEPNFLPNEIYIMIAKKLEELTGGDWEKVGLDFFEWCDNILLIYPVDALTKEELDDMSSKNQLFDEVGGILFTGWLGEEIKKEGRV